MCVCLCVTETTWDSLLCLLEKVNTVKVSVCKEWKVVCADTQTIADAVWTGCSYIVIAMLQRAEMHSHKHATQMKRCEMNRIVDWTLAFDQSPLYRLQPELDNDVTEPFTLARSCRGGELSALCPILLTEVRRDSYLQSCPRRIDKPQLSVWWCLMPAVSLLLQKPEERFPAACLHGAATSDV